MIRLIPTALFALWMLFTAYAQLAIPEVASEFTRLGFPAWFRIELSIAKIAGVAALLGPAPKWLKEWAYSAFAVTLVSALVAHLAAGDGPAKWLWPAVAGVLLAASYAGFRKGVDPAFPRASLA